MNYYYCHGNGMRSLLKEATSFGNVFPRTNLYLGGMRVYVLLTRIQRGYGSYHTHTEGITCRYPKARCIYAYIASNETSCAQETERAIRILENGRPRKRKYHLQPDTVIWFIYRRYCILCKIKYIVFSCQYISFH